MNDDGTQSEATARMPLLCLFCNAVIEPNKRGHIRLFCDARHRTAYRDQQIQAAITEAMAAVQEAEGEMARLSARLNGAHQLLERYQRKKPRERHQTTTKDLTVAAEPATVGAEP